LQGHKNIQILRTVRSILPFLPVYMMNMFVFLYLFPMIV